MHLRVYFLLQVMRENKFGCLCTLITETIKAPEVPGMYKLTCERWLTDFRELSSHAWENLPESEVCMYNFSTIGG